MSTTSKARPKPGAPFADMVRQATVPAALAGLIAVGVLALVRGTESIPGALLGVVVPLAFFGGGLLLLARLITTTSPHAFFATAMAVYLGQVIGLLLFFVMFKNAAWLDGTALGITAIVATLVWQVFAIRAIMRARVPVYDDPGGLPGGGS